MTITLTLAVLWLIPALIYVALTALAALEATRAGGLPRAQNISMAVIFALGALACFIATGLL